MPVSGSEVKVTWKSNAPPNSNIYYTVYTTVFSAGTLKDVLSVQVPGEEACVLIVLDELTLNLTYQFQVSASIVGCADQPVEGEKTSVTKHSTVTFGK